ncbi:acyl-CoA N-acyltransferase [Paxillus ammoniavirescens]|nr:acyl-CoA N-acyltransferase [Paxillus ammoniavirescens]
MNIRRAEAADLLNILRCNLHNLPENYPMRFWTYSALIWPEISFLAENEDGKVVGYVLCSIERAEKFPHQWVGHINSLSVLRPYRRMGLARQLMDMAKDAMIRGTILIEYIQLHVRKSNRAALSLYRDKLGYKHHRLEAKYYGDGEDAYSMRLPVTHMKHPQTWVAVIYYFVTNNTRQFARRTVSHLRRKKLLP